MDIDIDSQIEKTWRNVTIELKVIAYILRINNDIKNLILKSDYFSIKVYRDCFLIAKKLNGIISYDLIKDKIKIRYRKTYEDKLKKIKKIYLIDIVDLNDNMISDMIESLKYHYNIRLALNFSFSSLKNIETFHLEKFREQLMKIYNETGVFDLNEDNRTYFESFSERKQVVIDKITKKHENKFIGCLTGVKEFDKLIGGLQRDDFMVLAGLAGMGKTIFCINSLVANFKAGFNVVMVIAEMKKQRIEFRIDSLMTRIEHEKFVLGELTGEELKFWDKKIKRWIENRDNLMQVIQLRANCNLQEIEERLYRIQDKKKKKIDLLIIDYLNILSPINSYRLSGSDYQKAIVQDTHSLMLNFNSGEGIPIIAPTQLNDDVMNEERVTFKDLRYTKSTREFGSIVCALHQTEENKQEGIIQFQILKLRDLKILKSIQLRNNFAIMSIHDEFQKKIL